MPQDSPFDTSHTFFEQAPTAMWIQDGQRVVEANLQALGLFGCDEAQAFVGTDITGFFEDYGDGASAADAAEEALFLFRTLEPGEVSGAEWHCRRLDGRAIDIQADMRGIETDGRRFLLVAGRDVTEVNAGMQRLGDARNRMQEFVANFSHELRSSLFSILGFTSILQKDNGSLDISQVKEFLSILNVETLKLSSLVEDVLSISRINAGGSSFDRRPVDLGGVLEELVNDLVEKASAKGLSLRLKLSGDPLMVNVDPDAIKRAFFNILDNALKCTPGGGSIDLQAGLEPDRSIAFVEVRDSGIGIPEADIPHIFEKFYRVRRTGFDTDGYGLGLAISRQILGAFDALVSVRSEEGRGSLFRVELPLSAGTAPNP